MPITSVTPDPDAHTLTIVADYPVPVGRLWDAYVDPRRIERFWGPREWPATFTRHDMAVGGESHYHMTGPDGTISRGGFRFLGIVPHASIEVEDFFVGDDGAPNDAMPSMRMIFRFDATADGSRYTSTTWFPSAEAMEQLVQMGMMEGMRSAMSQVDDVLADTTTFAADRPAIAQMLSDTQVRVSRVVRGTPDAVWRAHHDASLIPRWMLGPDGWTMPVCTVATHVGDTFRYEWESVDGAQRFGFSGELLASLPPHRSVTTERMDGIDGPGTRNELTLTAVEGGTLVVTVITYPNREVRDIVLGTGMTDGMEASYGRLEREVLAPT